MSEIGKICRDAAGPQAPGAARGSPPAVEAEGDNAGRAVGPALGQYVEDVNATLVQAGVHLRFQLSRDDDEVVILVVDSRTGDVLKEVPPEYFLRGVEAFAEAAGRGLLLDEGL